MIVSELKKSLLQYAISGKLTSHIDSDTLVDKMLESISEQKLNYKSKLKKFNDSSIINEPFSIPDYWKWVELKNISLDIYAGGDKPKNFSKKKNEKYNIPVIANGETDDGIVGYTDKATENDKAVTVAGRGTIGFSKYRTEPFTPIVRLIVVKLPKEINYKYIQKVFELLLETGVGTSIKQLTVPMIVNKPIPVPPIEEQERIVKIIDEFNCRLNDISILENELDTLKKIFPAQLKKSILIYAVSGHLTKQNPNEKKINILEALDSGDLPENWIKVKAKTILNIVTGKRDANYGTEDGEYLFYTCANIPIKSPTYSFEGKNLILPGNGANVGLTIYSEDKFEAYQRTYVVSSKYDENNILLKYIYYYFNAYWNDYNKDKMFGSAIPYIKLGNLENFEINIPPIEEQYRIVAKIEELLPLCDEINNLVNEVQ